MERPGLIELAVYALVLTAAAGWVYALPPFEPGTGIQVADIEPAPGEAQASEPEAGEPDAREPDEQTASLGRAIGETPRAAGSSPDDDTDEPGLDPEPNLLVVTARSLNMRSEPDAGSALVGNYPRGARVEQVDTSGNWILVRTEDEATGWMYSGYLGSASD